MKKAIGLIIGIGFLHRLLFLGSRQLWIDELMQAAMIQNAAPLEILSRLRNGMDLAAPLDFLMQRGVTWLAGDSTWAIRFHAALFGTLAIVYFYRLAFFLFGARVAVFSALLSAFFPLAVHFSQEARPYSLLLLMSLISYDLLFRHLFGQRRRWSGWIPILAADILILYTSYLGALILTAQFAAIGFTLLLKPDSTDPPERALTRAGAAFGPIPISDYLIWCVVGVLSLIAFVPWIQYTFYRPALAPSSAIMDPKLPLLIIKELGDRSYPVSALLMAGTILGIRALMRHNQKYKLIWLLTWLIVPVPLLFGIEIWAGYFFSIRHLLHVLPPIVLLCGYGLFHLGKRFAVLAHPPAKAGAYATAFAVLLMCGSIWTSYVHAHHEPVDWRGAAAFLRRNLHPGDIVSVPQIYPLLGYYYPQLKEYIYTDLNPALGSLAKPGIKRRIVVCFNSPVFDPCAGFRDQASRDPAWTLYTLKGFTLFMRGR